MSELTHDQAIETFCHTRDMLNFVWGKNFQTALFFTNPYEGGVLELVDGQIHITDNFTNQEELVAILERQAM